MVCWFTRPRFWEDKEYEEKNTLHWSNRITNIRCSLFIGSLYDIGNKDHLASASGDYWSGAVSLKPSPHQGLAGWWNWSNPLSGENPNRYFAGCSLMEWSTLAHNFHYYWGHAHLSVLSPCISTAPMKARDCRNKCIVITVMHTSAKKPKRH